MTDGLRADLQAILAGALRAADAGDCVRRHLRADAGELVCGSVRWSLDAAGRLVVVGAGKAAGAMASAVVERLGDRIDAGLAVVPDGTAVAPRRVECRQASHPVPDERGVAATREILELVDGLNAHDRLICLLSGGASALLVAPAEGLSLADLRRTFEVLLTSGAPIEQINAVRRHLSAVKGGRLARRAAPASVLTLIVSDVVGNRLEAIASGPTAGDPTTFGDCVRGLRERGSWSRLPEPVRAHLERGARGALGETPAPGGANLAHVRNVIVGDNRVALEGAARRASALGYETTVVESGLTGEARAAGVGLARRLRGAAAGSRRPRCLLTGGETTVTVRGSGRGGRNQELALAAAPGLAGLSGILLASFGTDGIDGPTPAAGALVDGTTVERGRRLGLEVDDHLLRNDAYAYFEALGDLIVTGPTGTNVMDVQVGLVRPR